jgi:hypothetical protein
MTIKKALQIVDMFMVIACNSLISQGEGSPAVWPASCSHVGRPTAAD